MRKAANEFDPSVLEGIGTELEHIDDKGNRSEEVVSDVEKEAGSIEPTPDAEQEVAGDDAKSVDDDQAGDEDPTPLEVPTDEPISKTDDEPVLSDAYRRAAIHQGWKPEEVDELFEQNPELADRTFRNLYESTNSLSKQFAELGRASKESSKPVLDESGKKRFAYERMDIEALEKDDPDNPLIPLVRSLDGSLAGLADASNVMYDKMQTSSVDIEAARAKATGDRAVAQVLDDFFRADDMKAFVGLYGTLAPGETDWTANLTGSQLTKRMELIETAEQIKAGAYAQGKDMDVKVALDSAHLLGSQDYQEQAIRGRIKSEVKKRAKSLSINPKDSKRETKPEGAAATREELVTSVEGSLAAFRKK